jgi:hypothetical protein
MQRELTRSAESTDAFVASREPRRSLRAVVVPYFRSTGVSEGSNLSHATLLARLEAENSALRLRAAELALDIQKMAERST